MISRGHYWTSVQFFGSISCLYRKVSQRGNINILQLMSRDNYWTSVQCSGSISCLYRKVS